MLQEVLKCVMLLQTLIYDNEKVYKKQGYIQSIYNVVMNEDVTSLYNRNSIYLMPRTNTLRPSR